MYEIHDLWSVSHHDSVIMFELHDLWSVWDPREFSDHVTTNMIFDLYLLMVHRHVRTTWSLICISSWFSVMYEIHDLWSCISPWLRFINSKNYTIFDLYLTRGSGSCNQLMIVDLYLLMVQCHVRTTSSVILYL